MPGPNHANRHLLLILQLLNRSILSCKQHKDRTANTTVILIKRCRTQRGHLQSTPRSPNHQTCLSPPSLCRSTAVGEDCFPNPRRGSFESVPMPCNSISTSFFFFPLKRDIINNSF